MIAALFVEKKNLATPPAFRELLISLARSVVRHEI
jgi:hypothetical protein